MRTGTTTSLSTRTRCSKGQSARQPDTCTTAARTSRTSTTSRTNELDRSDERRSGTGQPTVFLVPDLMGSDLYANGTRIWLSYDALANGEFEKLADVKDEGSSRGRSSASTTNRYLIISR